MDELITSTSCPAPGLNNDRNGKAVASHQVRETTLNRTVSRNAAAAAAAPHSHQVLYSFVLVNKSTLCKGFYLQCHASFKNNFEPFSLLVSTDSVPDRSFFLSFLLLVEVVEFEMCP
ncbi:hypothetical protein FCV25MIE_09334 [Fagus crenata]